MKKNNRKKQSGKVILIVIVAIIVVGAGVFGALVLANRGNEAGDRNESINYDPPTNEQIDEGESIKVENEKNTDSPDEQNKDYSIFIVDANQYEDIVEVRAYVSDLTENDGSCSYVFSRGTRSLTKTASAVADAKTTICPTLSAPVSEFPSSGQYSLTITYKSAAVEVTSETRFLEIEK